MRSPPTLFVSDYPLQRVRPSPRVHCAVKKGPDPIDLWRICTVGLGRANIFGEMNLK